MLKCVLALAFFILSLFWTCLCKNSVHLRILPWLERMKLHINCTEKGNCSITKWNNRKDFNLDYFNFHAQLGCSACTNLWNHLLNCFTSVASRFPPLCVIYWFDPSPVSPPISTLMHWVSITLCAGRGWWPHFPWPLNLCWQLSCLKLQGTFMHVLVGMATTWEIISQEYITGGLLPLLTLNPQENKTGQTVCKICLCCSAMIHFTMWVEQHIKLSLLSHKIQKFSMLR